MELERKWMRFKPLISSWRREGQAYETVALKAFNVHPEDQRLVAHQERGKRISSVTSFNPASSKN